MRPPPQAPADILKPQNPFECLEVEKANKRAAELKKQAGKRVTTEMPKDARPQIVNKARGGYEILSTLAVLLLVAASFTVGLQLTVTSLTSTDVAAAAVQIAPVSSTFGSSNFGECNLISTDANVRSQPNRSALQQTVNICLTFFNCLSSLPTVHPMWSCLVRAPPQRTSTDNGSCLRDVLDCTDSLSLNYEYLAVVTTSTSEPISDKVKHLALLRVLLTLHSNGTAFRLLVF